MNELFRALFLVSSLLFVPFLTAAPIYDPVSMWFATNPSGPWSYLGAEQHGGPYTPLPVFYTTPPPGSCFSGQPIQGWWDGRPQPFSSTIHRNDSGVAQSSCTITVPNHMLSLDSQFGSVSLRFTVPQTGNYTVSGYYQHTDFVGGPVRIAILENGTLPLLDVSPLTGAIQQVRFLYPLYLNAGDTLDFVESSTDDYRFLSTGLSLQIEQTSNVPEPSSWQLLLLGAGGITTLCLRKATATGSSSRNN